MSHGIEPNDGTVWPRSEGTTVWWAQVGNRVLEGVAETKAEALREALNTERQMEPEQQQ